MFGDKLKQRRLQLGMSQEQLAFKLGYRSRSSIAKLESGTANIGAKKLIALAHALDTSPEELLAINEPNGDHHMAKKENSPRCIALIQAGGQSTRNGMNVPNQFIMIDDKPVIIYVLEVYENHPFIDEVDIICVYGWEKVLRSYLKRYQINKVRHIITGGRTIFDSVRNGYNTIKKDLHPDDMVILQEATRPMVTAGLISTLISSYEINGNTVITRPLNEQVQFQVSGKCHTYIDRTELYGIESPEVYSISTLEKVFSMPSKDIHDDGSCCPLILYRLGENIHFCINTNNNMKILRYEDSYIFKILHTLYL